MVLTPLGRPVFRLGTWFTAVSRALSLMAFNAPMPARKSSLFLTGRASAAARSFKASRTRYSDFGIVKLSRTNLCFGLTAGAAVVDACAEVDFFVTGGALAALGADAGSEVFDAFVVDAVFVAVLSVMRSLPFNGLYGINSLYQNQVIPEPRALALVGGGETMYANKFPSADMLHSVGALMDPVFLRSAVVDANEPAHAPYAVGPSAWRLAVARAHRALTRLKARF